MDSNLSERLENECHRILSRLISNQKLIKIDLFIEIIIISQFKFYPDVYSF